MMNFYKSLWQIIFFIDLYEYQFLENLGAVFHTFSYKMKYFFSQLLNWISRSIYKTK